MFAARKSTICFVMCSAGVERKSAGSGSGVVKPMVMGEAQFDLGPNVWYRRNWRPMRDQLYSTSWMKPL